MSSPVIEVTRGAQVEAAHPFSAVAVQGGQVVARWGPPITAAWRSAAKPFQLVCALEALAEGRDGAMLRPPPGADELAIGAASHAAEPEHVRLVRGLLRRFGVEESALRCGPTPPIHGPAYEALIRGGGSVGDIHNNCSGKHTFMLAASAAMGWTGDYRDPEHPLQRRIRGYITELAGQAPGLATDGCGVPTFCLPIEGFARAWATLAEAVADQDGLLGQVGAAMGQHPYLVSGTGRLDADLAPGRREATVTKIGAKALECVALPERRVAVVVKVHTGAEEALGEALAESLARFAPGAFERPEGWEWDKVRNVVGRVVGARRLRGG
ncbi:MAG: asparaginase [Alphaproteobacteria bacterium]|nr:asparaginase [Alphaproteobacteria bacterium]